MKYKGTDLEFVPESLKTPELCLEAIKRNGDLLRYVPKNLITDDMYLIAVKSNGRTLMHVPENSKTEELCLAAVINNGTALGFVPEEFITPELYRIAIESKGLALEYIPNELKTPELCLAAVKNCSGYALMYVPDSLKTEEMRHWAAVAKDWKALEHVPENMKTEDMCLAAVIDNGEALKYVPDNFKTPDLLRIAEKSKGMGSAKALTDYLLEINDSKALDGLIQKLKPFGKINAIVEMLIVKSIEAGNIDALKVFLENRNYFDGTAYYSDDNYDYYGRDYLQDCLCSSKLNPIGKMLDIAKNNPSMEKMITDFLKDNFITTQQGEQNGKRTPI